MKASQEEMKEGLEKKLDTGQAGFKKMETEQHNPHPV